MNTPETDFRLLDVLSAAAGAAGASCAAIAIWMFVVNIMV